MTYIGAVYVGGEEAVLWRLICRLSRRRGRGGRSWATRRFERGEASVESVRLALGESGERRTNQPKIICVCLPTFHGKDHFEFSEWVQPIVLGTEMLSRLGIARNPIRFSLIS